MDDFIQYFEKTDIEGRHAKINNNTIIRAYDTMFLSLKIKKEMMPLSMVKQLIFIPTRELQKNITIDAQFCEVLEERNRYIIHAYCINNTHKDVIIGSNSIAGIIRPIEPERLVYFDEIKEGKEQKMVNNINQEDDHTKKKLPFNYQHDKDLSQEEKIDIENLLTKHHEAFIQHENDKGVIRGYQEKIELDDYTPIHIKQYPLSKIQEQAYEKIITDMLSKGQLELSTSDWNTPVLIVPKKKPDWPIIKVEHTFERLDGCVVFASLDLKDGYFQMELEEDSRDVTSFSTPTRKVRYKVLPQGLMNSMFSFNKVISSVLYDLDFVVNFVDDIIIGAKDMKQLLNRLDTILVRLKSIGVKLSGEKAFIGIKEVDMLGYTCSKDGIGRDQKM
eukprot:Awhi_evm2s1195